VVAADGFNFDGINASIISTTPVLAVSSGNLAISARAGGHERSKSFEIWNAGGQTLTYTVQDNASWLSVTPASGTSTGERDTLTVQANPAGLTKGVYNGLVTVAANAGNAPLQINVTLTCNVNRLNPTDYDGDGRSDITAYRPADNSWRVLGSDVGLMPPSTWGLLPSDLPVAGDYDRDGTSDVSVYQDNGTWHLARSAAHYAGLRLGNSQDIPVPADYDGDGATDMAIFEPATRVWHMSRTTEGYFGLQFGKPGDLPVPADYDGDGRADIAVFSPSNQEWRLRYSSDPGTPRSRTWGLLPSDQPVPADYDGDGIDDVAVYQANGTWHLSRSAAGYAGLQLGAPGDIPVPADFDGDGAVDMAIFETKGVWHLSQTSEGYRGVVHGAAGDFPVRSTPWY